MASLAQINDTQVSIINFKSVPVLTSEQLAGFYGTEAVRIQQNHTRNKDRFIEGKHFFKIIGQELKDFVTSLKIVANFPAISNKTRSLILWTERGAARHAKMLDTDQAWEVFEQLEDCYFVRKEILAKTHKSEREPLTNAVNLLVAKTKHLNYSDAYKLVHQRFNVQHIDEIPYDSIPIAVEYIHHLIALYSNADKQVFTSADLQNVHALASHMIWVMEWWRTFGGAIRTMNPTMAGLVQHHFSDGSCIAWRYIDKTKRDDLREAVKDYPWLQSYQERWLSSRS
ncbi:ORF6N domain-containing protein [Acinetobacter modestus]|uniref:ORF6N domain-containing protein n=1 Tax=Acinetobacter modestus TaxID=1776740 RepID=UPI001F4AB287|nr:ORF6N domain-containing protein [Acinetobacter modestus]MCH7331420.1 ORF6N domain-containing protein [Acinetobacter modestus]